MSGGEILEQAEKISSLIATARKLMGEGKTVDLSNLEGKIQALCKNAESAQLKRPDAVRAALETIAGDLDRLDDEMTSRHGDAGGRSLEDTIKRAIDAYKHDSEES